MKWKQASAIVSHLSQSIMLQTKLVCFCHNTCSAFSLCCWTVEKHNKIIVFVDVSEK